jgi:hypothetical protein
MRKSIIHAFVIILFIIAILTPWVDGVLFKRNYFRLVNAINNGNQLNIEVLEYKQGWIRSYAKVRVTLLESQLKQIQTINAKNLPFTVPMSVTLDEKIDHGPVIYNHLNHQIEFGYANIQTYLYLTDSIDKSLLGNNGKDNGLLKVTMLSKFDGDWNGELFIPKLSLSIPSSIRVVWNGLNGDFHLAMGRYSIKHLVINSQIGSILFESHNNSDRIAKMNIAPMQYRYDGAHEKIGLWSGNTNMYLPGATVIMKDGSIYDAKGIDVASAFSATSTTFYNTNFTVSINNLITPSHLIPYFSKLRISLSANEFSAKDIYEYIKFIKSKTLDDMKDIGLRSIEAILVRTIIPSSYFNIDAESDTSLGLFSSHSNTSWNNDPSLPNTFYDVIANSITVIKIKASAPIAIKIIEMYGKIMKMVTLKNNSQEKPDLQNSSQDEITNQIPSNATPQELINELVLGGYMNKEDYGYSATLTVDNGVWKINGLVISPSK